MDYELPEWIFVVIVESELPGWILSCKIGF